MKKTFKHIGMAAAATIAAVSCNLNSPAVFDDADAFVAFDKTSMSVKEDAGEAVKIPVTLASVKGLDATVAFKVNEPEDKGGRAGQNYQVVTTSGTLTFDAEHRTQYIEIMPVYYDEYTGDLSIEVELLENENINIGSSNTCTLVLADVDHPMNFLAGEWTMTGEDLWDGPSSWIMTVYKDATDDHKIWFTNLYNNSGWARFPDLAFCGNVNDDCTIVNIPFGQESAYKYSNGNPVQLLGFDGNYGYSSGSMDVTITRTANGVTLDFGDEFGFWGRIVDAGNLGVVLPGLSAEKN